MQVLYVCVQQTEGGNLREAISEVHCVCVCVLYLAGDVIAGPRVNENDGDLFLVGVHRDDDERTVVQPGEPLRQDAIKVVQVAVSWQGLHQFCHPVFFTVICNI